MIIDDKRREVAENLRYLTFGHHIQYKEQFFDELVNTVIGFVEKLADLIDTEGGDDD